MKTTIVIIIIAVTLLVAGILYGGHVQTDDLRTLPLEEAYNANFPVQLPNVVMQPMNSFQVY
jgi:hypothetical protein